MKDNRTTQEQAEVMGVPEQTLRRWRMKGEGPPYVKWGNMVRYPIAEYERWVATHVRPSESAIS